MSVDIQSRITENGKSIAILEPECSCLVRDCIKSAVRIALIHRFDELRMTVNGVKLSFDRHVGVDELHNQYLVGIAHRKSKREARKRRRKKK